MAGAEDSDVILELKDITKAYSGIVALKKADLKPGDLVFYSSSGSTGSITHVALYAGNGKIIQARKPGVALSENDLATWWTSNLVGYGRVPASAR